MQPTTLLSMASAMAATVSAQYGADERTAPNLNANCDLNRPHARIINRCDYDVHIWSVLQSIGCPETGMVTLKTGEAYSENLTNGTGDVGISIKISKTQQCKGTDITQLEYFLKEDGPEDYRYNYLDVSYVDCLGMDCPAREDGYYLVAGSQTGKNKAAAKNTWCPILSCSDAASCDQTSYVLPDDVQTKTCSLDQNITFYMCGSEAPNGDDESATKPESSSKYPTASSISEEVTDIEVAAAAITSAPQKEVEDANNKLTKTEIVYVTAYEYVNAKRHAHGHARRHAGFHA